MKIAVSYQHSAFSFQLSARKKRGGVPDQVRPVALQNLYLKLWLSAFSAANHSEGVESGRNPVRVAILCPT
jgi:hypothetical protein